jgi:hypothetical protein
MATNKSAIQHHELHHPHQAPLLLLLLLAEAATCNIIILPIKPISIQRTNYQNQMKGISSRLSRDCVLNANNIFTHYITLNPTNQSPST